MKRKLVILFVALAGCVSSALAQGIEFFEGDFAAATEKARAENKILFVDFYADWCGPCRQMSEKVFPERQLGEYFNSRFVSLKLDTEAPENLALVKTYKIKSLPTVAFINAEGKILSQAVGLQTVEQLLHKAKVAIGEAPAFEELYNAYRKSKNDTELMRAVLKDAPLFVSTLDPGLEQDKWIARIERIFKDYYTKNLGPHVINSDDYMIITTFHPEPKAGDQIAEFIVSNMDAYLSDVGVGPAYYAVTYNDRVISDMARAGKQDYKKYIARISGEMKSAYDAISGDMPITPQKRAEYIYDGEYLIFSKKNSDAYVKLMEEYLAALGDYALATDYGEAAQKIYYATGGKVSDAVHEKAREWIVKALQYENIPLMDKLNFLVMLGDTNRALKKYDEAKKSYNQAYMEAFQLNDNMAKAMMQMQITNKISALDMLQ